ncbi:uncharacterized protein LOC135693436 [Rhopilema esculentum]|uniref:uncharacterized protein LOC135693436 n=1 Tax=Rhopilema esculentum TaxID=499914 RepID=UPI0031DF33EE
MTRKKYFIQVNGNVIIRTHIGIHCAMEPCLFDETVQVILQSIESIVYNRVQEVKTGVDAKKWIFQFGCTKRDEMLISYAFRRSPTKNSILMKNDKTPGEKKPSLEGGFWQCFGIFCEQLVITATEQIVNSCNSPMQNMFLNECNPSKYFFGSSLSLTMSTKRKKAAFTKMRFKSAIEQSEEDRDVSQKFQGKKRETNTVEKMAKLCGRFLYDTHSKDSNAKSCASKTELDCQSFATVNKSKRHLEVDNSVPLQDSKRTRMTKSIKPQSKGMSEFEVVEKSKEMILIDNYDEVSFENISSVTDITTTQIRSVVRSMEPDIRSIFEGTTYSARHQEYKKGGASRARLVSNSNYHHFTEEQQECITDTLRQIFCYKHTKYFDYILKVLVPETMVMVIGAVKNNCKRSELQKDNGEMGGTSP